MRTCKDIVNSTVETLESLEVINDAVIMSQHGYPVDMDTVKGLLQDHLDEKIIDSDEFKRAVSELESSPELLTDDGDDVFKNYLDDVLDIEVHGKRSAGEWDVTGVKVWLTLGGPNVWIMSDLSGDNVQVFAAWGTDSANSYAYAPGIVSYLQAVTDTE